MLGAAQAHVVGFSGGRGRVTVRASEPAGIAVDARGNAISWVVAVRRRIVNDLNGDRSGKFKETVAFHRT
jgi:hypothetical protein